jgi:hypothetical protein
MRKAAALLLRLWITEFLAGERPQARFPNRQLHYQSPVSDDHFVETMFRSFSHQATIAGRRVGCLDCMNLSIWHLGGHGSSGSSPFSRAWAEARAQERQRIRYLNHLLAENQRVLASPAERARPGYERSLPDRLQMRRAYRIFV